MEADKKKQIKKVVIKVQAPEKPTVKQVKIREGNVEFTFNVVELTK